MNKISLVSLTEYEQYKKRSNRDLIFAIIFLVISLTCFALSIVFSSYELRTLWMILGSFLSIVPFVLSLCFFLKRKNELDTAFLYSQILNETGEEFVARVDEISEEKITLQNGFEVISVKVVSEDNKRSIFVLVDKFDLLNLTINKSYHFCVVSSYLKEISDA